MGKSVSPAGGRSRRGMGAALVQGPQYPGQTCPGAGLAVWVPGRGEGEALRAGAMRNGSGTRGRSSPHTLSSLLAPPGGSGAGGRGSGGGRAGRGGGGAAALASPGPARPQPEGAEPPPAPGGGCPSSAARSVRSATNWKSRGRGRRTMGAGAAGCAMDPPRLLLLLLGVSASRRGARSLSLDRNPRGPGFPEGKQNPALGSQMLGMDGGRGAPMPGSTEGRLGFPGRRGDPEIQGRDADQRCARMRALRNLGVWVWRRWEGLRGGGPAVLGTWVLWKRALECQDLKATPPPPPSI